MSMREDGVKDLGNLFNRVTSLEQQDMSTEEALVSIIKNYAKLGLHARVTFRLHQFPVCGSTNPLAQAYASPNLFI